MNEHPNAAEIRKRYEAFAAGDVETATAHWSPDIVWHELTGSWELAGTYRGKDAVLGYLDAMMAKGVTAMSVDLHDVVANDTHAVALITLHVERGERSIDVGEVQVWHYADGVATEVWVTATDPTAYDAFWAD